MFTPDAPPGVSPASRAAEAVHDDHDRTMREALGHVDCRLLDVQSLQQLPDGTYPPVCGHSGFWQRPEYREAVATLESVILPAGVKADAGAAVYPAAQQ